MLNYRCSSPAQARELGKGRIRLRECQTCGLIFNGAFDLSLISYDSAYDNRQGFSGTFRNHLESVADRIASDNPGGAKVLEVGCGKGEFLRLLRDRGCAPCVGYDTSCPDAGAPLDKGIRYHCSYVSAEDIAEPFDYLICRHVVEHVPEISAFLKSLADMAVAAGGASIVIETPEFGWIAENGCFWDVFYEHCNYFTFESLQYLCAKVGLEVRTQDRIFGDQYQLIIATPAAAPPALDPVRSGALAEFLVHSKSVRSNLESAITEASAAGSWAIWGAGAKGVTLASRLGNTSPAFVIDSNPDKVGCRLPASAVEVVSPLDPRVASLKLVVIANPIYENEILGQLERSGFHGKTLTV